MSKELPYFKFFPSEWINGTITLEEYELQGLFINICAYYWGRKCDVSKEELNRRFKGGLSLVEGLLKGGFIECLSDDKISIKFLDEQHNELSENKAKLSEAGRLGVLKKKQLKEVSQASATLKPPLSNKEEEKNKKKNNSIFLPPSIFEVKDYFKQNGYTEQSGEKAFNYYNIADWKDSKGNKVKNWKQKMVSVWFKEENKIQSTVKKMQM